MKAGILLLARMAASRLPGKLMKEVMGRPLIDYQIERLRTSRRAGRIVLCTTTAPDDDVLAGFADRIGLEVFRGHPEDVVDRMVAAASHFDLETVISIGGDDVFSDPQAADRIVESLERTGADFAYFPELPSGTSPYGVTRGALERLLRIKIGGSDGWERYFQEDNGFRTEAIAPPSEALRRPELRMTLDYPEDFLFFQAVLESLYPGNPRFSLGDIIALRDRDTQIAAWGQARAEEWTRRYNAFHVEVDAPAEQNR